MDSMGSKFERNKHIPTVMIVQQSPPWCWISLFHGGNRGSNPRGDAISTRFVMA